MANEFDPTTSNGAAEHEAATNPHPSTPEAETKRLTPEHPQAKAERVTPVVPKEVADARNEAPANDSRADDEAQAVRSLDDTTINVLGDTTIRTLPNHESIWAEDKRVTSETTRRSWKRIPTFALVGAVAVVSFVAGGVFARMSAQMPTLVAGQPAPSENTASCDPVAPKTQEESEEQKEDSTHNPPSYDTGYDTTDDAPPSNSSPNDDTTHRYDFDEEGNESLEYDEDTGLVTIDYDGYSLTVPIDELLGDDHELDYWSLIDSYGQNTQNYGDQTHGRDRDHRYDYGTGYDTEEERDRYGWGSSPQGQSWNS